MELTGKVAVVTGGASGIGAALARRFAAAGAAGVVVADLNGAGASAVAADLERACNRALGTGVDVTVEHEVQALVERTRAEFGRVDLFCSNAGVATGGGIEAPDEAWERSWAVNVMAHVYAARAVLPVMLEQGGGYLLQTCSAAGLLTAPGDAPYTAAKHAAVAFAEWLAITYGDRGIRVSALCPAGVRTPMLLDGVAKEHPASRAVVATAELLEPEQVADAVIEGLAAERFLILPHPQVAEYARRKAADLERWLDEMRKFAARVGAVG